jgi:NAD(P)-dependent dehydrogenase (short-subunit alcohol dehydrogenase family)
MVFGRSSAAQEIRRDRRTGLRWLNFECVGHKPVSRARSRTNEGTALTTPLTGSGRKDDGSLWPPEGFGLGRLAGKRAIVTGAGSRPEARHQHLGIGAAAALAMALEGAEVTIVDLDETALAKTARWAAEIGLDLIQVHADVSKEADCRRIVATASGALDILVNNAAIRGRERSVTEVDSDVWMNLINVNVTSMAFMCKYAIPAMRAQGGGSIINLSSIAAIRGMGAPSYAASKGAVVSLTTQIAASHGREGIRANAVLPGHVDTPMAAEIAATIGDRRHQVSMLGTAGNAWDVANAVVFLGSDAARWITAVTLPIDAGASMIGGLAMLNLLEVDDRSGGK